MTKNLWEQERKSLLYSKIKEYQDEVEMFLSDMNLSDHPISIF